MRLFLWFPGPVLMLLAALPAEARPRDDALAGAFRCAVIGDARAWLDCYYGAAQPVRAGLGLAPALAAQVKLALAPPAGGAAMLVAVRDEVMARAAGCMRVAADRAWLDCYYAAATPMRAQMGLSVPQNAARIASIPAPVPVPQLASVPPQPAPPAGPPPMPRKPSLFTGIFNSPKPIVVDMPMKSYALNHNGTFTVTLADGQVWEQLDEDQAYHPARWRKDPSELLVTIKPDTMRIFIMTVPGEGRLYKVRRIH